MKWNSSRTPSENPLCECLFFIGIALNLTINFNFFSQRKQSNQNKKKAQFSGHHWTIWRRKERVKAFPDAQLFGLAAV